MPAEQKSDLNERRTERPPGRSVTQLVVTGMTCGNCVRHVTDAIQHVPGVRSAMVSIETGRADIQWQAPVEQNVPAVIRAIQEEGYGARVVEVQPRGNGRVESRLAGWRLNLCVGVLGSLPLMIGEWGFQLGLTPWFRWFSFALAGVVQIFAGARFYRGAWNQLKAGNSNMDTLVALGSTTAFAYSAWALLGGLGGHLYFMEAASIITLISAGHWMESRMSARASSALRELLNLAPATARRLGPKAPGAGGAPAARERFALPTLAGSSAGPVSSPTLAGPGARLFEPFAETNETEVPVAELKTGDLVVLRPGDRVPVDGEVISGDSAVDESMLTGESMPVDKTVRSRLCAGTVNLNGFLRMRVTATGDETALAHIIAAVQRAQTSRANIQRLGDRVSSVFVPVVVAVAIIAGLSWGLAPASANQVHLWLERILWTVHTPATAAAAAFMTAAAVLIVACPCAMGLATPAAIMAGSNAAARRGILIRDGVALEKAGRITAAVFDKTGTLTEGHPKVAATRVFHHEPGSLLQLLTPEELGASLASLSSHPLSRAVSETSATRRPFKEFREIPGCGVAGLIECGPGSGNSHRIRLGSLRWLAEENVDIEPGAAFADEWMTRGATVLGLAVAGRLAAAYALQDSLKPGAAEVMRRLESRRLASPMRLYLVSGDSNRSVQAIAIKLGIPESRVFSEVRPERKAAIIRQLQEQGERVAFVGDGINDAPALEQADLGIAVCRASDIAREAADIILLNSEIEAVPESIALAQATLRTIKQNLFWAFFYNALSVPLAALGFLSPILCAAAMGVSDLIVIGNALRLRNWKWR